jgi:hypothetical protein
LALTTAGLTVAVVATADLVVTDTQAETAPPLPL